MSENKRSSPRVYNVVEVECHTIDETATLVAARMSDVSTTGALLDSMSGLQPGTKLALRHAFASALPGEVLNRPKASFPLPFQRWAGDP